MATSTQEGEARAAIEEPSTGLGQVAKQTALYNSGKEEERLFSWRKHLTHLSDLDMTAGRQDFNDAFAATTGRKRSNLTNVSASLPSASLFIPPPRFRHW